MRNNLYEQPGLSVILFPEEDVIRTSGENEHGIKWNTFWDDENNGEYWG